MTSIDDFLELPWIDWVEDRRAIAYENAELPNMDGREDWRREEGDEEMLPRDEAAMRQWARQQGWATLARLTAGAGRRVEIKEQLHSSTRIPFVFLPD